MFAINLERSYFVRLKLPVDADMIFVAIATSTYKNTFLETFSKKSFPKLFGLMASYSEIELEDFVSREGKKILRRK